MTSNYQLQCVSETQRQACPAEVGDRLAMVENGVPLLAAAKLPKRRNYALMLSRMCPEKNLHTGLEAARISGVPILLAGDAFPYESTCTMCGMRLSRAWGADRWSYGSGSLHSGWTSPLAWKRHLATAACTPT